MWQLCRTRSFGTTIARRVLMTRRELPQYLCPDRKVNLCPSISVLPSGLDEDPCQTLRMNAWRWSRTSSPLRWLPGVLCGCPERLRHLTERLVPQLLGFLAQGCGRPAPLIVILTRDLVVAWRQSEERRARAVQPTDVGSSHRTTSSRLVFLRSRPASNQCSPCSFGSAARPELVAPWEHRQLRRPHVVAAPVAPLQAKSRRRRRPHRLEARCQRRHPTAQEAGSRPLFLPRDPYPPAGGRRPLPARPAPDLR